MNNKFVKGIALFLIFSCFFLYISTVAHAMESDLEEMLQEELTTVPTETRIFINHDE